MGARRHRSAACLPWASLPRGGRDSETVGEPDSRYPPGINNPVPSLQADTPRRPADGSHRPGTAIILEEAAYVDSGVFYETVAPLMVAGTTPLIGISTLRDGINFYTRLIRLRDKGTGLPMFSAMQVQLACDKCKEDGKATDCVHGDSDRLPKLRKLQTQRLRIRGGAAPLQRLPGLRPRPVARAVSRQTALARVGRGLIRPGLGDTARAGPRPPGACPRCIRSAPPEGGARP
jgi:hypothetical protein